MRPNITIAHEESCLKIEIHYPTDSSVGFVSFTFANKKDEDYDFDNAIRVDLGIFQMAYVQEVLTNQIEAINDGKPLKIGDVRFIMKHIVEPVNGYAIGVKQGDGKSQIVLDNHEALAVSEALKTAFFFISFVKGVS